jgi:hypothetical protein
VKTEEKGNSRKKAQKDQPRMDTNGRENDRVEPTPEERRLIFENPLPYCVAPYLPASVSLFLFVFFRVLSCPFAVDFFAPFVPFCGYSLFCLNLCAFA